MGGECLYIDLPAQDLFKVEKPRIRRARQLEFQHVLSTFFKKIRYILNLWLCMSFERNLGSRCVAKSVQNMFAWLLKIWVSLA